MPRSARVFISYAHEADDPAHGERVLALADRLREDGLDARLDQYVVVPPKGWQLWMEDEIEAADFVVIVATETYERRRRGQEEPGKGLGVRWEGAIIGRTLYEGALANTKFIPVVLEPADAAHIPVFLRDFPNYRVATEEGYDALLRRLTDQPEIEAPPVGSVRERPLRSRREGRPAQPRSAPAETSRPETPAAAPHYRTPAARRPDRYAVGFGAAVGIGLAPFLGQLDLPLFTPLLHLIPRSLRGTLLPLSAALMGLVAVAVQWYGQEKLSPAGLRKSFRRTLLGAGAAFLLFLVLHLFLVVRVSFRGGESFETFVVGFVRPDVRPEADPCRSRSNAECIQRLTLDEKRHASYWGDRQLALASLCLELAYLLLTGAFGALVGLVVLRRASRAPS